MSLTYKDIELVPRQLSTIKSRNDVDLSIPFGNRRLLMPILHSPMDTIGGSEMCKLFLDNGLMGCFPKHTPYEETFSGSIVSIGVGKFSNIEQYYGRSGVRYYLIDVANGFNSNVEPIINKIRTREDTFIITGNVASAEGYIYLAELGVDAIRVGIGTGSACLTTVNTGIGQSLVDSVNECYIASSTFKKPPLIIADGGIRQVGDISKILAVGADLVMLGRMFAGCRETPGNVIILNGEKYKAYRGSASYASQTKHKDTPYFIEGEETLVKYKGSAQKVLNKIDAGLRSAFSYMGVTTVKDFRGCYYNDEI